MARIGDEPIEIEPNLAVVARLKTEMAALNREQVEIIRFHYVPEPPR
jgi:hypothetical protein